MKSKFKNLLKYPVAITSFCLFGIMGAYSELSKKEVEFTVEGKYSEIMHNGQGLGFTKDVYKTNIGNLENTIEPLQGKFSRASINLEVGKTYKSTINGWGDSNLLNWHRNILKATPVKKQP